MIFRWLKELAISSVAVPVTLFRVLTSNAASPIAASSPSKVEKAQNVSAISTGSNNRNNRDLTFVDKIEQKIEPTQKQPGEFIDLEFGPTHYFLKGPKDGQLVVLLHGVSVFSFIWNRFADLLADRGYRVLTFDILYINPNEIVSLTVEHFYGHGYSAVPQTNYTVDLFRNQFEQILTKLNLFEQHNSMVLMGHSMGGTYLKSYI
jgi:hypothetical protein